MTSENKDLKEQPVTAESDPAQGARRAYHAPKLRRLGSVRELTLGTGQAASDGGGPRSGNQTRGRM